MSLDEKRQEEAAAPPPQESAIRRQRNRPMWGCVRTIFVLSVVVLGLIALISVGIYSYLGTDNFAEFVRMRIERNLESHLGREVTIERVTVVRKKPSIIIIENLHIANAPGASRRDFATVRRVVITGGLESFWQRVIRLGRIDVYDPRINFEVFPEGSPLMHNFPTWKASKPRRYEITRLEISKMFVNGGAFEMLDRRHDITALVTGLAAEVTPTFRKSIYEGIAKQGQVRVSIQDYKPFDLDLRGGFLYRPGSLDLRSIALRGRGIEAYLNGKVDPLTEAVYDFRLSTRADLARIKEIFAVEQALNGRMSLDGTLRGKSGNFELAGDFVVPALTADAYDLADVRGRLNVTDARTTMLIQSANYGGGTLRADYLLTKYAEPYPMSVELRYDRIAIEKLFADWTVPNTGLRGGASGTLKYQWNKDDILGGQGTGKATLNRGAVAFGNAKYPVSVAGRADFALDRGVIRFTPSRLDTGKTKIVYNGTLRIEDLNANLNMAIESTDFSELDRIAFNFARSLDKPDFELLGLGGRGSIRGTVQGPLETSRVTASIEGSDLAFNNVTLGSGNIDLRYIGPEDRLVFERSLFRRDNATLAMTGSVFFPDSGPTPRFDLVVEANGWDVAQALAIVELELAVSGTGTGRLRVIGTPDIGTVYFEDLRIARNGSTLRLDGSVEWRPGEGNVGFDLDIAADRYPIEDILAFLEMTNIPATGAVTGTLHVEGQKAALEGAGSLTLREGSLFGESVDVATADIVFERGVMRATHIDAQGPAGRISGEAEVNLGTEQFSYIIRSAEIDPSRVRALAGLSRLFGGRLRITSSGAGTFDQPELVIEATLDEAAIQGLEIPPGSPPPTFYLSLRGGQLVIRGSAFDAVSVEGGGSVAATGELAGNVRVTIADFARALQIFAPASEVPLEGNAVIDLALGGRITPIEQLQIVATIPVLSATLSGQPITPAGTPRIDFRDGAIHVVSFNLATTGSTFAISGTAGVTGDQRLALLLRGGIDASLLSLFMPDVRAEGTINIDAGVNGTLASPRMNGSAEILGGRFRFAGFPQVIDDVRANITFDGTRIKLESVQARLGGGTVFAGGSIELEGYTPGRVEISFEGRGVSLRYYEGVTLTGDFDLRLAGDAERLALAGDVQVSRALYSRDFDITTAFLNLLLERRGLLPEIAASWQDLVSLDVRLNAPDALAIRNNIADVTGSAELELRGTLANPVLLGLVEIDEGGTVRFQDVEYRVTRGTVNFQNPFQIDPYFDITAEGRRQEYDLTINITGTLDRIEPSITSDPPASDITLLTLFAPELGTSSRSALPGQSLQTAGTSLLLQSVGELIGSRILPFADAVRIDPGLAEERGTQVTFEKQISDDLRVIVIYNTGDQRNRQIIEWQVNREWVLQFTRDDQTGDTPFINAIDVRFRRRYEGRW